MLEAKRGLVHNTCMSKQYSEACERNGEPILDVLRMAFADCKNVLEIGSGTGQHAVYFSANMPHLRWHTSDLPVNHPSIRAWQAEAALPNVLPPIVLDVGAGIWPQSKFDAVFTANTCHIMSWKEVQAMFEGLGSILEPGGMLGIYGPFNYDGAFTSQSNQRFDAYLKAQALHMGIRDFEAINLLASRQNLSLQADESMPANNRLLVWRKSAGK